MDVSILTIEEYSLSQVIQRRGDFQRATDYFYKNWEEYKKGFGDLDKAFWLGKFLKQLCSFVLILRHFIPKSQSFGF